MEFYHKAELDLAKLTGCHADFRIGGWP